MAGNHNRFAEIDLGNGSFTVKNIEPENFQLYIGGSSLAARLFLDLGVDSEGKAADENPLFIMTGPMVGSSFPGTSRFVMAARSPLTGIWGESTSGGGFGAKLKMAGWDGLWLMGRAEKPVYLLIEDDRISIEDASAIWGMDTYDSVDALREKHGDRAKVLVIGPAGENRVAFASVCNDKAHYFGRTGMGAVLGGKKVKALVVKGRGRVPAADEALFKEVRNKAVSDIRESMISGSFHDLGTAAAMDIGTMTGDVPIRNWGLGEAEDLQMAIGGVALEENYITGRGFCFACPIGCKPVVTVEDENYPLPKGPGPEYETLAAFGTMIMNDNLAAASKANEVCNRLGMDTITCGTTVAFIMEAYEKGLLTRSDLDGLDLTWGNMEAVLGLLSKIARKEGFGARASNGSAVLARELGKDADDFCSAIKGLEMPMHDPRAFHGLGLAYMMSNRGACHLQHSDQAVEQGMVSWTELGIGDDYLGQTSDGKAELVYVTENIGQVANALCVCHFVHWAMGNENLLAGFNAVTGYEWTLEDLVEAGQRAWAIKRSINNILGVTSSDDRLPKRASNPPNEGPHEGSAPDVDLMKREYYEIRGLDDKGRVKPEVLNRLKIDFVTERVKDIYR